MSKTALIPFAVASDGRLVAADDPGVRRGLACNCRCPQCHEEVIARQGNVRAWGFAHQPRSDCSGAYESSLHLAVKELIAATRQLLVPRCVVRRHHRPNPIVFEYYRTSPRETIRDFDRHFPRDGIGETEERIINFDDVRLEQVNQDIRADIVGVVSGEPLYIEVAVTHFVDDEKRRKLERGRVPAIELDVSGKHGVPWTWDELRRFLLVDLERKDWLLHPATEDIASLNHEQLCSAHEEWKRKPVPFEGDAQCSINLSRRETNQAGRPIAQIRADARAGKQLSKKDLDALIATLWR